VHTHSLIWLSLVVDFKKIFFFFYGGGRMVVVVVMVDELIEELRDPPEAFAVTLSLEHRAHEDFQGSAVQF